MLEQAPRPAFHLCALSAFRLRVAAAFLAEAERGEDVAFRIAADAPPPVGVAPVAAHSILDDGIAIVAVLRIPHAEGIENPALHECGGRFPRHSLDDLAQKEIAAVGVALRGTRGMIE